MVVGVRVVETSRVSQWRERGVCVRVFLSASVSHDHLVWCVPVDAESAKEVLV